MTVEAAGAAGQALRDARGPAAPNPSPFVSLPAQMRVEDIRQLEESLLRAFGQPLALFLDARHVRSVDTASLQLIVAALHRADAEGLQVFWEGVSPEFDAAASCVGLAAALRLPPRGDTAARVAPGGTKPA